MTRTRVCIVALFGFSLAVGVSPATAQIIDGPTIEWKHSNWGKRRANTEFIEKMNETLKARTGGKFSIRIGYGEVFSKDKENLDSIKLGAIDTADVCNFYHPGKNPAWMVFSLPFLPFGAMEQHYRAASALMKHPELVKDLSPRLRQRMQGKSCFNFTTIDPVLLKELGAVTKRGLAKLKKIDLPWGRPA